MGASGPKVFDPCTGNVSEVPPDILGSYREGHTSAYLGGGAVLAIGGNAPALENPAFVPDAIIGMQGEAPASIPTQLQLTSGSAWAYPGDLVYINGIGLDSIYDVTIDGNPAPNAVILQPWQLAVLLPTNISPSASVPIVLTGNGTATHNVEIREAPRLYLTPAGHGLTGTLPTNEQGLGAVSTGGTLMRDASATSLKAMTRAVPSGAVTTASFTNGGTTSSVAYRAWYGFWASPKLQAQTFDIQTMRFNFAASTNMPSGNARAFNVNMLNLYVWRPGTGAKIGTLFDNTDGYDADYLPGNGSLKRTIYVDAVNNVGTNTQVAYELAFDTTSAVTCQADDVLILEVWSYHYGLGSMTTPTGTLVYNGTDMLLPDNGLNSGMDPFYGTAHANHMTFLQFTNMPLYAP